MFSVRSATRRAVEGTEMGRAEPIAWRELQIHKADEVLVETYRLLPRHRWRTVRRNR